MDHLLAADVLIGEHAALPIVSGGSSSNISNNVCYLTSRVVDKLWQGTFANYYVPQYINKSVLNTFEASIFLQGHYQRTLMRFLTLLLN